jgi:predicted ATPase/DNA-binding SARP family transcriptional activator
MLPEPWRIELLGRLRVRRGDRDITRFKTHKTGALLSYLAYHTNRIHPREFLIELFWPEDTLEAGRNSLRVALNSLRRQLEPPGDSSGTVLIADRASVRLNMEAFTSDVADFEAALKTAHQTENEAETTACLIRAIALYCGELLPGHYEEWALTERERLAEAYLGALRRLIRCLAQARDFDRALDYARRAVNTDPLREESCRDLMRLYIASGQPSAALNQFRQLEQLLKETFGIAPSAATRQLAEQLEASSGQRAGGLKSLPASPPLAPLPTAQVPDPLASTASTPPSMGSLPLQFTHFFGRGDELVRLRKMLGVEVEGTDSFENRKPVLSEANGSKIENSLTPSRLVTLTGTGGTGKTRLALETVRGAREAFAGGIWFVPLADLADSHLILDAVLETLHLRRAPGVGPLEQIASTLSLKPALLVLDNFEHLVTEGAPVVLALLEHVPSLTVLVTSRRLLGLAGEREFLVSPLPIPEDEDTPERHFQVASVRLFVDRAQAVRSDFQLTPRNASDIADVCRRLEGIPLAIELAAARVRVLTPAQMQTLLAQRFDLLVNSRADKDARHRSLRAAIEWSYNLLTPKLRQFFTQLSVFQGGWTLESAAAVCGSEELPSAEERKAVSSSDYWMLIENLEQLRTDSLILCEEDAQGMRFRMLETLREFAGEQLMPGARLALEHHHAAYFTHLAEKAHTEWRGREQTRWLQNLDREQENLRAALTWLLTSPDGAEGALRMAGPLWWFWATRGQYHEGRHWLVMALQSEKAHPGTAARARALEGASNLALHQGDFGNAQAFQEESLAIRRNVKDTNGLISSLTGLGTIARHRGDEATARSLYEESLTLAREAGDRARIATAYSNLGTVGRNSAEARAFYEAALATRRELGDTVGIAVTLNNLGSLAYHEKDYVAARAFHEESLALQCELDSVAGVALSLLNLGETACALGDHACVSSLLARSMEGWRRTGSVSGIAGTLQAFANLAAAQEKTARGVCLWAAAATIGAAYRKLFLVEHLHYDRDLAAARALLGEKAFEEAWERGRAMTQEQAIAYALQE